MFNQKDLITAKKARKIADANQPKTTEELVKIHDAIAEAARHGKKYIFWCRTIPNGDRDYLISLGFKVVPYSLGFNNGDRTHPTYSFKISW